MIQKILHRVTWPEAAKSFGLTTAGKARYQYLAAIAREKWSPAQVEYIPGHFSMLRLVAEQSRHSAASSRNHLSTQSEMRKYLLPMRTR
jgi:hypothetical protein